MDSTIVYFSPSLVIPDITIDDTSSDGQKSHERAGEFYPFVSINGLIFAKQNLLFFKLSLEDFLPTLSITVTEVGFHFINKFYPMDGDTVSVLLKSKNTDFQQIRQDFRVTGVDSSMGRDGNNTYEINAVLDVPDLYVDKIKSFANISSVETLKRVARELGLGFASNVQATNDVMTRVCPNTDYLDFILNDVLPSAYKDDSSFFTCFIDQYYVLNFIEVNTLLVGNKDIDSTTVSFANSNHLPSDPAAKKDESKLMLTNSAFANYAPNKIEGYSLLSRTGEVSLANGYRTYVHYYDKTDRKAKDTFIETLNDTSNPDDVKMMRGKDSEDHTKQIRSLYFGNLHKDNVFSNYYYAKVNNSYNNSELLKFNMFIMLGDLNPSITKFMPVPVFIVNRDKMYEAESRIQDGQYSVNELLTSFYCSRSIEYLYDGKNYSMNLMLSKREFTRVNRTNQ